MQDTQKFHPIKGFESYYEINKIGNIRSVKRFTTKSDGVYQYVRGNYLKPELSNRGYYRVLLSIAEKGIKKKYSIHRLVALTFIDNPENLPLVNHKNKNTKDNHIDNLEFCTSSYNNKYKYDNGYISHKRVLKEEAVIDIFTNVIVANNSKTSIKGAKSNVNFFIDKYNTTRDVIYGIIRSKTYLNVTKNLKRK